MLLISLAIPVLFHGIYNFYGTEDVFPILTVILVISIFYWARKEQSKKIIEEEENIQLLTCGRILWLPLYSLILVILVIFSAHFYS